MVGMNPASESQHVILPNYWLWHALFNPSPSITKTGTVHSAVVVFTDLPVVLKGGGSTDTAMAVR